MIAAARPRRTLLAALLAALLLPGNLIHAAPRQAPLPQVWLEPMASAPVALAPGLTLGAMWRIAGNDWRASGWSALLPRQQGRLLAFSDRGMMAVLDPAGGRHPAQRVRLPHFPAGENYITDIESATGTAVGAGASGPVWLGLEFHNALARMEPDGDMAVIRPPAMAHWPVNGGAEAMARLADGRFLVLSESGGGLLFPADPLAGSEPRRVAFALPDDMRPTDAAPLPDGSVLVLARSTALRLPPFGARLLQAFPARIGEDGRLPWRTVAPLVPPLPSENYEGLALVRAPGGGWHLYLLSDDNQAALQQSLLVRLDWTPEK